MTETSSEVPVEGTIDIEVTDMGHSYTMSGRTYSTSSRGSMLLQNYKMPEDMAKDVVKMAIKSAQGVLADSITKSIASDVERLYGKQIRQLAKEWARKDKEKIVDKLLAQAKSDFMKRFEDYDD